MKVLTLDKLSPRRGSSFRKKIVGRGISSGHGKTSTRGHKGQKARSGKKLRPGFEGGQMPLIRRIPKYGFRSFKRIEYQVVNVKDLNHFAKDSDITLETLQESGLIKDKNRLVKILGEGSLTRNFNVSAHAFSKSAKEKIEAAGGKVNLITV